MPNQVLYAQMHTGHIIMKGKRLRSSRRKQAKDQLLRLSKEVFALKKMIMGNEETRALKRWDAHVKAIMNKVDPNETL